MINILLLDDEPNILSAVQRLLRQEEAWKLHAFSDPQEALDALAAHEYAVIVSDYQVPGLDGVTFLQFAKQSQPHAVRMILSAYGDRDSMMHAINKAEIYRFLPKPWDDHELRAALRSAIDLYQLREENQRLLAQVRQQQQELLRLEAEHPGLTRVRRDADGAVLLEDGDGE